jgi:hypothetical protein
VGLILLFSGLAGFQVINTSAYAQLLENSTAEGSSAPNLPSNILQNQLSPDQNSLIATPGPLQQDLSSSPNAETSSENAADEQSLDTDETIENSIVQSPAPRSEQLENSGPGVGEPIDQPSSDDSDNSASEDQRGDQEAPEANEGGDEEDEEEEEEEEEKEDVADGNKQDIPSSLRNWLPFP